MDAFSPQDAHKFEWAIGQKWIGIFLDGHVKATTTFVGIEGVKTVFRPPLEVAFENAKPSIAEATRFYVQVITHCLNAYQSIANLTGKPVKMLYTDPISGIVLPIILTPEEAKEGA